MCSSRVQCIVRIHDRTRKCTRIYSWHALGCTVYSTHCTSTAVHNAENVRVYCNKCDKSVWLLSRKKILFDSYVFCESEEFRISRL
jgi:hypothetical protein